MNRFLTLLALLLVATVPRPEIAHAGSGSTTCDSLNGKRAVYARTFLQPRAAHAAVTFSLTYEQFIQKYAIGGTVEVYHKISEEDYEDGYVYDMDVGLGDLGAPTAWAMPEIDFDGIWRYRIEAPENTPYADRYPTATHVLVEEIEDADGEEWYEYYAVTEEGVDLVAYVSVFDGEVDYLDFGVGGATTLARLAVFPLDETLGIYHEVEEFYDVESEQTARFWQEVEMHGFGTLTLGVEFGGETLDVGAFIDDQVWQAVTATDPSDVIGFDTRYSFFGEGGTWLQFSVAQDPDEEETAFKGQIEITDIELWRVTPAVVSNERSDMPEGLALSAPYPNPASGRATLGYTLAEAGAVSLTLYDVLGRRVATVAEDTRTAGSHTAVLDASHLPGGVYVVQMAAGSHRLSQRIVLH